MIFVVKYSSEHLTTVIGAEIWMPEHLVSADSLLWSMNNPKAGFIHQKIHKEFRYPDYAICAYLKRVSISKGCLRLNVLVASHKYKFMKFQIL